MKRLILKYRSMSEVDKLRKRRIELLSLSWNKNAIRTGEYQRWEEELSAINSKLYAFTGNEMYIKLGKPNFSKTNMYTEEQLAARVAFAVEQERLKWETKVEDLESKLENLITFVRNGENKSEDTNT